MDTNKKRLNKSSFFYKACSSYGRLLKRTNWVNIYIFSTAFFFLFRVIFFASEFGAVEHDSGWYLGVARNLAQRGIYASYTNTIREEGIGAQPSIHGRFSVQDNNGYSYFPAGVTAGPGYVIPQAILLKILSNFLSARFMSEIRAGNLRSY